VIAVGVQQAVVLAIILSLLDYVRRGYRPARSVVTRCASGHLHRQELGSGATASPGLIVYRFGADLFYANTNGFNEDLLALAHEPGVEWICIDAASVSDIDYSGWKTLVEVQKSLDESGIRLVFADVGPRARRARPLRPARSPWPRRVFSSVADAIDVFEARQHDTRSPR
jgi:sulfate permease, SulP family